MGKTVGRRLEEAHQERLPDALHPQERPFPLSDDHGCYALGLSETMVVGLFQRRYGEKPTHVFRADGFWRAGPIPEAYTSALRRR